MVDRYRDEQTNDHVSLSYISSMYNYAGTLYNRLIEAFNKGDMETARKEMVIRNCKDTLYHKVCANSMSCETFMRCAKVCGLFFLIVCRC